MVSTVWPFGCLLLCLFRSLAHLNFRVVRLFLLILSGSLYIMDTVSRCPLPVCGLPVHFLNCNELWFISVLPEVGVF